MDCDIFILWRRFAFCFFILLFSLGHEPRLFRLDHESERRVSPSTYFPSVRLSLSTRMFLGRYPNCVVISTLDFIPERRAACLPVYITKEIDGICFDFYFSKPPADKESGRSKRRRTLILALVFLFFFSFFDCWMTTRAWRHCALSDSLWFDTKGPWISAWIYKRAGVCIRTLIIIADKSAQLW